jgi:hypothetical protein
MQVPVKELDQLSLGITKSTPQPADQQQSKEPVDVIAIYPVLKTVCSYLETAQILPLMRVSRKWTALVRDRLKKRLDVNKKLERFVEDPKSFRSVLEH